MTSSLSDPFVTVQKIYYPSLCAIGIPANFLTIYTLYSRRCGMSMVARLYLISLAVADSLCLFWGALIDLSLVWLDPSPFWVISPWCELLTVLEYGSIFTSTWIVITFTIERYLVLRSTRVRQPDSQTKVTIRVIISVAVASHLIAAPAYWIYNSELLNSTVPNQTEKARKCTYSDSFFSTAVVWFYTLVSGGIPYILLILFNILIGHQLYTASRMFTQEQLRSINGVTVRGLVKKSILILFTISFTFVLLTLPRFVTYCILRTAYNRPDHNRDDYNQMINFFADIGNMMQWLNFAINFLLYCVISKSFRQEFLQVLTCRTQAPSAPNSNTQMKVYSIHCASIQQPVITAGT
ncbi:probable G-protein coupled receptor 139 [Hemitrygon akajei]|uniref:probable G-protein coupled receptor 139 n=1 Tax=Hemitrygon akajei TaxID=2704970 RepID=UPI003BF996E2